jgi:gliding motility-associated-like protein
MNFTKILVGFLFFACFILASEQGFSQITSTADAVVPTEYSSGVQDNIHVFCSEKGELKASLTASYLQGETGNFEWLKYNSSTGIFDLYSNDQSGNQTSTISNLTDGCYRVNLTTTSGAKSYTAWVFNNYLEAKAEISLSDCNSFTLNGTFDSPNIAYTDLSTGQPKELNKQIKVEWSTGEDMVSHVLTSQVFDPPTKNTNYTLEVTDRFGCVGKADVLYYSLVTKALFTYQLEDQGKGSNSEEIEAPATYTFTNTSENGDLGKYEWYFYKSTQQINEEKDAGTFKDSIQDIIYSDNPVYTYEKTGDYKVKLVSKKISESTTCTDYFYMKDFIVIGSSFIDAPNVFTPNGDGANDEFVVKFFSMKTVKITIVNRWGKVLHVWESNNVQGFYNTASSVPQSVWNGKVGGQMATPGVYFYVAEGIGRDGEKRSANGFFHLFRDK